MNTSVDSDLAQRLVSRFSTDDFYLWIAQRHLLTDSYTFKFQHGEKQVVVTATAEEWETYRDPVDTMFKALMYAKSIGMFMPRILEPTRLSLLVAQMPDGFVPPMVDTPSSHGPTEAMLEASYRV